MRPFALAELSPIAHTLGLVERDGQTVLVVAFEGDYRDGSQGAPDARLMRAVVAGALVATRPDAIVLDLRALGYRWGNNLLDVFIPVAPGHYRSLTYALVVSDRCEAALRSLLGGDGLLFPTLDDAVAHAAAGACAIEALEDALEDSPLTLVVRDDLSADQALQRVATVATRAGLAVEESALVRAWSCGTLAVAVERLPPDAFTARAAAVDRQLVSVDGAFAVLDRQKI